MQVNQDMDVFCTLVKLKSKTLNQEKVQMTITTQKKVTKKQMKVVKLIDENKDFETHNQQDLNHNGNRIYKQTNSKEERGIEMRKETTNKPKKEPF